MNVGALFFMHIIRSITLDACERRARCHNASFLDACPTCSTRPCCALAYDFVQQSKAHHGGLMLTLARRKPQLLKSIGEIDHAHTCVKTRA